MGLEERLRDTLLQRAEAFETQIEEELSELGSTGPGPRHALELFLRYADALKAEIALIWEETADPGYRLAQTRVLMAHLRERVELFDLWFSRDRSPVSTAMATAIERDCTRMGLPSREAVLTIGPPGNYHTYVADLHEILLQDLEITSRGEDLATTPGDKLVVVAMPPLEGRCAAWQPIVLGHELAHYLFRHRQLTEPSRRLSQVLRREAVSQSVEEPSESGLPRERALEQAALRWLNELMCDAYAVHRYGPAAVAALLEFLDSVGATTAVSGSHPPGWLRAKMMFSWLGDRLTPQDEEIVGPFRPLEKRPDQAAPVDRICDTLLQLGDHIMADVAGWSGSDAYLDLARSKYVKCVVDALERGTPASQFLGEKGDYARIESADIMNAVWLAGARGTEMPVDRLMLKALDDVDFLIAWEESQGEQASEFSEAELPLGQGVLGEDEIRRRLGATDETRLSVSPLLPAGISGASLDLRLGNTFIVFERSAAPMFDSLDYTQHPRSMQARTEKAWGDVFYLHPGELVLAGTLEYLVLPADLTAQVVTRSSYGRLGLLSATAVQVHPGFAGCLTLELANLGEIPLVLTPGERIAQLLLFTTIGATVAPRGAKYRYATGPEFSKIRRDPESAVLHRMRVGFAERRGGESRTGSGGSA